MKIITSFYLMVMFWEGLTISVWASEQSIIIINLFIICERELIILKVETKTLIITTHSVPVFVV